ncbi:MAG: hypothetical protein K2W95_04955 [Candidatus Obscuribacterales bacterium]|nr:hypothetical protein [Candidatus Obscuribacterales bacterium]
MRVVNVTLPIVMTAMFFGFGSAAWAGGSSAPLDPYSYIQAPTKEEREATLARKKTKKKKTEESASSNGEVLHRSVQNQQNGIAGPFDVVFDGVKQSTAGLGKGAKAAGGKIASGTAGVFRSTAALPSKLLGGGKNDSASADNKVASSTHSSTPASSAPAKVAEQPKKEEKKGSALGGIGEKFSGMNKAVAGGFMSAGGAMKSGTASVAKGFKSAGGKLVDGTQAAGAKVASLPKAIGIGGKAPKPKTTALAASTPSSSASGAASDSSTAAVGAAEGLRPAVPMNASAVAPKSDGGPVAGFKKLAGVPKSGFTAIGNTFGKLNPFNKDKQAPEKTSTAAKEAPKSL